MNPTNPNPDSLAALIQVLQDAPVENDAIYALLNTVDIAKLNAEIAQFKSVDAEVLPTGLKGKAAKQWSSDKNGRKGKAFESILSTVLMPGGLCFTSWQRLQTDTNELDFLVALEPISGLIPVLREWGTHFICECKSTESFTNTWLEKLFAVINFKQAKIGLVLSKKRPSKSGNSARAHQVVRMAALLGKTLLTFDMDDIESCANGTNFLMLIRDRYLEVLTGVNELRMITGSVGTSQTGASSAILPLIPDSTGASPNPA